MGRAIALEFARQGARVAIADIAGEAARQTANIIHADGGEALALEIDVTRKKDVQNTGICVTAISPGSIETPLNAQAAGDPDLDWGGETIVGRWGTGQDVANTAVFLASDESGYITGSEIAVEGGWLVGRARDGELGMHAENNT